MFQDKFLFPFQLTAALRNLADTNTSRDRLLNCRILDALCFVSDKYSADGEIILNVSRIFRYENLLLQN